MTGTVSGPRLSPADAVEAARGLAPGLAGRAAASDPAGAFPVEDFDRIRSAGLLGLLVPTGSAAPAAASPTTPRSRWRLPQATVRPRWCTTCTPR